MQAEAMETWEAEAERGARDVRGRSVGTEHRQGQGPAFGRDPAWKSKTQGPRRGVPRGGGWKDFYVKNALLSPGPSPRGSPRRARAAQLQPPGDKGSRGDGRTPQSSPSPAHPGQRHLHRRGGSGERGRLRVRVRPAARTRRPSALTGGCEPPGAPRASPGGDPDWTRRRFRLQDRKRAAPRERGSSLRYRS